ncbi:hypothetical protein [Sulfuriroseicoccus oceanibius]|uniref:Uncharacterized protein n=1 Tax=Sulfuriroseicoccus oceanibius TaxID=2707525 RepID=A0A6B3L939_9BACT|nr:hypothetical protein [Sulfuriroseicoccus oceanibius]QQL43737.1 hypothetical protein G3M56_007435 [Sulfuriroseicoccus oceanibius]
MRVLNLIVWLALGLSLLALLSSCGEQEVRRPPVVETELETEIPVPPITDQRVIDELKEVIATEQEMRLREQEMRAQEQELRVEAENRVEEQSSIRQHWELAAFGLGVVAVIGFFAGTSIGSRGRRHAARE